MARPRDPGIEHRIVDAVHRVAARDGAEALTLRAVAREAGVGFPAVRLRFPDRASLLMAAAVTDATPGEATDTGSFAGDLRAAEDLLVASLTEERRPLFAAQIGSMIEQAEVSRRLQETVIAPADALMAPLWSRAVERGEVDPELDGVVALQSFSHALLFAILVLHRPVDGPWRAQLRSQFLRGVAAP